MDLALSNLIENVFIETDTRSVHRETEELANWRAVKYEPAGNHRRITDESFNVEGKVGKRTKISNKHIIIAVEACHCRIVRRLVGDKRSRSCQLWAFRHAIYP